jgi:hypothetical protein
VKDTRRNPVTTEPKIIMINEYSKIKENKINKEMESRRADDNKRKEQRASPIAQEEDTEHSIPVDNEQLNIIRDITDDIDVDFDDSDSKPLYNPEKGNKLEKKPKSHKNNVSKHQQLKTEE